MARYRRVQTVTHDIGPKGTFSLSVTSADIQLTAGSQSAVEVQATFEVSASNEAEADTVFEAIQLRVESGAGRLEVSERDERSGFGAALGQLFGGRHVELEDVVVSAPVGASLEIRSVSGDVRASGFRGPQRLQTVSGDVRVVDAGGELDVDSVSGDISVRAVEPVTLKANTVSGDLSAEAPRFTRFQANAVSGDVSIDGGLGTTDRHRIDTVSGDARLATNSPMTLEVHALSSDIHASLPHRIEGRAENRRLIIGDGEAMVTFNSMSGDLTVTTSRHAATAGAGPTADPNEKPAERPADADRLAILTALETGEIDVDEAMRRLGGPS
jgi:DUF4097 and DUF4098 domain-containing protein YvlB